MEELENFESVLEFLQKISKLPTLEQYASWMKLCQGLVPELDHVSNVVRFFFTEIAVDLKLNIDHCKEDALQQINHQIFLIVMYYLQENPSGFQEQYFALETMLLNLHTDKKIVFLNQVAIAKLKSNAF